MANECMGTSKQSVVVNITSGEFLHYRVEVEGAEADFAFGCAHRPILSASDIPGHPKALYEWTYLDKPGQSDAEDDVYGLSMQFASARKYILKIDHRRKDGSVIEEVSNWTCESDEATATARRTLEVFSE